MTHTYQHKLNTSTAQLKIHGQYNWRWNAGTDWLGKLKEGSGITLVPSDGDLSKGDVKINSTGGGDSC